jgi:hypothetical protein
MNHFDPFAATPNSVAETGRALLAVFGRLAATIRGPWMGYPR